MSPSAATKAAPRASNGLLVNENEEWDAYVGKAVRRNAQLLVEGQTRSSILEDLKQIVAVKQFWEIVTMPMLHFHLNFASEGMTRPFLRVPPLDKNTLQQIDSCNN